MYSILNFKRSFSLHRRDKWTCEAFPHSETSAELSPYWDGCTTLPPPPPRRYANVSMCIFLRGFPWSPSRRGLSAGVYKGDAPNGVDHGNAFDELLIGFELNDDDGQSANVSAKGGINNILTGICRTTDTH